MSNKARDQTKLLVRSSCTKRATVFGMTFRKEHNFTKEHYDFQERTQFRERAIFHEIWSFMTDTFGPTCNPLDSRKQGQGLDKRLMTNHQEEEF